MDDGDGPAPRGLLDEEAAVGFLAGQREEQEAGLDGARVVGQARDFRRGGPLPQAGRRARLEQAAQFQRRDRLAAPIPVHGAPSRIFL